MSGIELVESNYIKDQTSLIKVLYHECYRTFGDKIIN